MPPLFRFPAAFEVRGVDYRLREIHILNPNSGGFGKTETIPRCGMRALTTTVTEQAALRCQLPNSHVSEIHVDFQYIQLQDLGFAVQ